MSERAEKIAYYRFLVCIFSCAKPLCVCARACLCVYVLHRVPRRRKRDFEKCVRVDFLRRSLRSVHPFCCALRALSAELCRPHIWFFRIPFCVTSFRVSGNLERRCECDLFENECASGQLRIWDSYIPCIRVQVFLRFVLVCKAQRRNKCSVRCTYSPRYSEREGEGTRERENERARERVREREKQCCDSTLLQRTYFRQRLPCTLNRFTRKRLNTRNVYSAFFSP